MDDTQVKVLGGLWRNVNQVHSAAMRYGWTVDAYRTAMLATLTGEPATPAPDSEKLREAAKPFAALADEWDRWQAKGSTSTPTMIRMSYGKVRFGLPEYQAIRAALGVSL